MLNTDLETLTNTRMPTFKRDQQVEIPPWSKVIKRNNSVITIILCPSNMKELSCFPFEYDFGLVPVCQYQRSLEPTLAFCHVTICPAPHLHICACTLAHQWLASLLCMHTVRYMTSHPFQTQGAAMFFFRVRVCPRFESAQVTIYGYIWSREIDLDIKQASPFMQMKLSY